MSASVAGIYFCNVHGGTAAATVTSLQKIPEPGAFLCGLCPFLPVSLFVVSQYTVQMNAHYANWEV